MHNGHTILSKICASLDKKNIVYAFLGNEVVASLNWGVEGIEKIPHYGDCILYNVNGKDYGVKPTKEAKHDLQWYYDELKTGMKGANGYCAGLTQFLNVWIRKGELKVVYKGKHKF